MIPTIQHGQWPTRRLTAPGGLQRMLVLMAAALIGAAAGTASPLLFAIHENGFGSPQTLVSVNAPNGPVTDVRPLGDGSVRYGGGLAWDAGANVFYSFESDSLGLLSLVSFTAGTGPSALIPGFGYGTPGGLAYTGTTLYGILNDELANSTLVWFDLGGFAANPLFGLGQGFLGGLAWDPVGAKLYAIQDDSLGASSLIAIDLAGSTTSTVKALGYGFYGGLAIDPATGVFWAVASDENGAGTLYDISSNNSPVAHAPMGDGYLLAALSLGPPVAPIGGGGPEVPEPATFWLAGCGALAVLIFKRM